MAIIKNKGRCNYLFSMVLLCTSFFINAAAFADETDRADFLYTFMKNSYGFSEDRELNKYVRSISDKLASASKSNVEFKEIVIVSTPDVFAFTNYNYIFITAGLIAVLENEAELAAIIGHELSHIISDHKSQRIKIIEQLAEFSAQHQSQNNHIANDLSRTYELLELQRVRREFEKQADKQALIYLLSSNYNPYAYMSALKKLEQSSHLFYEEEKNRSQILSDLLNTHPRFVTRIDVLNQLLNEYNASNVTYRQDSGKFKRVTDGMLIFSENQNKNKTKIILRYANSAGLIDRLENENYIEYILLLNNVDSVEELQKRKIVKTIVREPGL